MSLGRLFSGAKGMHRVVTAWMMLSLVSLSALAQDVTVSGKVVGSDGDGIPGVTVQVKGAQKGFPKRGNHIARAIDARSCSWGSNYSSER